MCSRSPIFYLTKGEITIDVGDDAYRLSPGDAMIILAGLPYRITTGDTPVNIIAVNFNFFTKGDEAEPAFSIPMHEVGAFKQELVLERPCFSDGFLFEGVVVERTVAEIRPYLEKMTYEFRAMEPFYGAQVSRYLGICITFIYRRVMGDRQSRGQIGRNDILRYLAQHFNEPLTNDIVGEKFHYHPNYVNQLIKEQTGLSLHKYLLRLRMLTASDMLLSTEMSISEISATVGFGDTSYFSQYFKRCYGCTPVEFRGKSNE